jgi:hypothetical protein
MAAIFDRPATWWATLLAAALLMLVPLTVVDVPPLLDYPNHLARMYLHLHASEDPVLSSAYASHWDIIPNLAIDLLIPALARFMPLDVAGRVTLGLVLLLLLAGMVLYSRAAFGRRSYWPIAGALMGYNALFLLGFVNFLTGLGMGLLTASAWIGLREKRPVAALVVTALGVAVTFFCHIFGIVFCAVLIGAHEATTLWRAWRGGAPLVPTALRRGAVAAPAFLPALLLYGMTELSETSGPTCWLPVQRKIGNLVEPFMNYYAALDRLTLVVVLGVIATGFITRRARAHAGSALALLVLLVAYAVTPFEAKGAGFVDTRIPIMLGLLLFAGVLPLMPRRLALLAGAACAGLFVLRTGMLTQVWTTHAEDLRQMRESIAQVAPGSRVMVANAKPAGDSSYWAQGPRSRVVARFATTEFHMASLVILERRAFIPTLFSSASQQPIRVLPPYDALSARTGVPSEIRDLSPSGWTPEALGNAPYLRDWQQKFDYLLVLNAGAEPDLPARLPPGLELLNRTGIAALFRVQPGAPSAGIPPSATPAAPRDKTICTV